MLENAELRAKLADVEQGTSERVKTQLHKFKSAVTHGLRLPISVIQGYANLLCDDMVTNEAVRKEYLIKICERTTYMENFISELLRKDQAQFPVANFRQVDISALLHQIVEDITPEAKKYGITMEIKMETPPLFVEGEVMQLTSAFYNILENALKYMGRQGTVTILGSRTKNGDVRLEFTDDGLGLDEESTRHVFEANYQGPNGLHGSGMGLYLTKMIVLYHGGMICAKSAPNYGLTIFVQLPEHRP